MRDHYKLRAFELADELALVIYKITWDFPKEELYGLTSQMKRAVVSVPTNIVEGCARESTAEYLRFLEMSFSSLREVSYEYSLAKRLGFVKDKYVIESEKLILENEKVLAALIRSLRKGGNH